jgi:hypothetical protein
MSSTAVTSSTSPTTIFEERRVMFDKIRIRHYERSLGKNSEGARMVTYSGILTSQFFLILNTQETIHRYPLDQRLQLVGNTIPMTLK